MRGISERLQTTNADDKLWGQHKHRREHRHPVQNDQERNQWNAWDLTNKEVKKLIM